MVSYLKNEGENWVVKNSLHCGQLINFYKILGLKKSLFVKS